VGTVVVVAEQVVLPALEAMERILKAAVVVEVSEAANGGAGGSGVVIIKVPITVTATFTGATFGNNSPDFDNSLPITSVTWL
jgi:hypothetical protein